jgi:L-seryl-tRNA(Ser) seleniumtransferase
MLNNNPNEDTIGRPCKVGKEEILAMFVALERYMRLDHNAEWKDWEQRIGAMEKILSSVPGIHTGRFVPDVANHVPHLYTQWDESALGLTKAACAQQLREGEPSIEVLENDYPSGLSVTPFMMKPGEELIVARRMKAVFLAAQKKAKA